ncbi:MAG: hypothetical protein LBQ12_00555 [Deltaproteobacteria bacterium]|nr:hypothetical protein [Deltaproteobacteria bacterium]
MQPSAVHGPGRKKQIWTGGGGGHVTGAPGQLGRSLSGSLEFGPALPDAKALELAAAPPELGAC